MSNQYRNHPIEIIEHLIKGIRNMLIPALLFVFGVSKTEDMSFRLLFGIIVFICITFFIAITTVIKWYKRTYFFTDQSIQIKEGVFVIRRREMPFNKIQTVNINQNVIQRLLRVAEVKVDSGSNGTTSDAEITLIVGQEYAESLRNQILNSVRKEKNIKVSSNNKNEGLTLRADYKSNFMDLFFLSITSNILFTAAFAAFSCWAFLDEFLDSYLQKKVDELILYLSKLIPQSNLLFITIFLIPAYLILSLLLAVGINYIKYYHFTVRREADVLVISFGLFEQKRYTIPIQRISAVYYKQNILRQLFNIGSIHVESIGYGDERGEEAIFIPIAKKGDVNQIIRDLLPEFQFAEPLIKVPPTSIKRFVTSASWVPFVLCIAISIYNIKGLYSFFAMPAFILLGFIGYKNSAIAKNEEVLCLTEGSLIKTTAYVMIQNIQSVSESSNYFQRRKKLFNFFVSIHGNSFGKTIGVKNLSTEIKNELLSFI